MSHPENATFVCFKPSGKYYAEGRGHFPNIFVEGKFVFDTRERLAAFLAHNGGAWPGLSGPGESFVRVAFADKDVDYGWPQLFRNTVEWR